MAKEAQKLIANNKKAFHDYFVEEQYEAGMALAGTEVKSLRQGKCSIKEAFVQVDHGELYVYGMNISPYEKGNIFNKDPLRTRKLLMHKAEIRKLESKCREKGYTIMPLKVYFKDGRAKMEIGLCRGKKLYEGILKSRTEHVVVLEIDGEDVSFETNRIAMVRPSVQFE